MEVQLRNKNIDLRFCTGMVCNSLVFFWEVCMYLFESRNSRFVARVFNLVLIVPFRCKFESKPLPTFSWYIDDEKLTDSTEYPTELSEDKMSQTLNYGKPREGHSNKTLKCVVDFNEYGLKDTFEESLVFDFPENVVLVPKKLDAEVCKMDNI